MVLTTDELQRTLAGLDGGALGVVGGPGAFVIPIKERDQFKEAIRTKLVLEIAGRQPQRPVVPAAAAAPRVSCTIGERLWQERWGN